MPFKTLSERHRERLSIASIGLPIITMIAGIFITAYLVQTFRKAEMRSHFERVSADAKEYSRNIEFSLLNNALRLQTFLELIDMSQRNPFREHSKSIKDFLQTTVFQRISVFSVTKKIGSDGLPILLRTSTNSTEDNQLPEIRSPFMQSPYLRRKIAFMRNNELSNIFTINHTEQTDVLNLVWKSRYRANEYLVLTSPLRTLMSPWIKNHSLLLIIRDPETRLSILVKHNANGEISTVASPEGVEDTLKDFVKVYEGQPMTSINSSIQVLWYSDKQGFLSPITKLMLITGLFLTFLLASFLHFILDQNRRISNLIVARTEELNVAMTEAQEANLSKTRFLANMSHELRTPLNIILGMLDLVEGRTTDSKSIEFIQNMRMAGDQLLGLITDLLSVARENPAELNIKNTPFSTLGFIEEVGRLIGPSCRKKNLIFDLKIDPQIPETLYGDPSRVRQILTNLLKNSIKYTNVGFVRLHMNLHNMDPKHQNQVGIRFEVIDSGIGIPKSRGHKIFDRFFQLESSKMFAEGGVGLGLSIVRDLTEKMNGHVSVRSEEGLGSTFIVDLDFGCSSHLSWMQAQLDQKKKVTQILLVSHQENFYKDLIRYLPDSHFSATQLPAKQFLDLEVVSTLAKYDKIVIDASRNFDEVWIAHQIGSRKYVFIGNEEDLTNLRASEHGRIIDDCPLLPSRFLSSLEGHNIHTPQIPLVNSQPTKSSPLPPLEKKLSVIVVDDDLSNQDLMRAYLEDQPWDVTFANQGAEALEIYKRTRADLIIADLRMPVMDGFQLADEILLLNSKSNRQPTPVILVTADAMEETLNEAQSHGVTRLLTKPIRKRALLETIQEVTGTHH